jgi:hypothetical protein
MVNILSFHRAGLALTAIAFSAVVAWCQSSNGSVRGTVVDTTKAVIPGAAVHLTSTTTNVEMKTSTNGVGIFVFPSVVPGPYRLAVESPGMGRYEAAVSVSTQESASVEVTLQPAGTATTIRVDDVTPLMTTDSPELGQTLERERIEELPINGRNVSTLLNTVPGVMASGTRAYGVHAGAQEMVLDGAPLTDHVNAGFVSRQPSLDSIAEFRVVVNSSSAKYKRQSSIILTTKGGTNQFHGTLFETNRNSSIGVARARNNFTNTAAHYVRNEFGGTAGGPVYIPKLYNGKNRTFWFFSYESFRQRDANFSGFSVPTEAMRNGDFSGLVTSSGSRPTLYNPYTTDTRTRLRQPFNYGGVLNRIDPSLQSPLMKHLYSVLPLPTLPDVNPLVAANYYGPTPNVWNQWTTATRIDQHFSSNDMVYVRLSVSESRRNNNSLGVTTLDQIANYVQTAAPNRSISAHHTHTFSPTLFNEFMFSATRTLQSGSTGDSSKRYATELGLPNPNNQWGFPVIDQIGVGAGTGGNYYFQSVNAYGQRFNYFLLEDNVTKIKGRHELQFGAHLRYDQLTYLPQQQQSGGFISFPAIATALYDPAMSDRSRGVLTTGHIAASAYLGLANYTYPLLKSTYYIRRHEDAAYFQDNIRVGRRLILNLGVRWQFSPFPKDKYDVFSSFDVNNMAVVLPTTIERLTQMGATTPSIIKALTSYGAKFETPQEAGMPQRLINNNWFDLGPHVGFAYRLGEGRKSTVLRGGFSLNYFPVPMWVWNDQFKADMPFKASFTNSTLTAASQSPDGQQNYGLVSVPTIVAGRNSSSVIDLANPSAMTPGGTSFQMYYYEPDQPSSRIYDWNFTIEREIMRQTLMRLSYIGNWAPNQEVVENLNESIPSWVWFSTTGKPTPTGAYATAQMRPLNSTAGGGLPYGNIGRYSKLGWSRANGFQAVVERRLHRGVGFQVFYNLTNIVRAGANSYNADSTLSPITSFLPGAVPTDATDRINLLLRQRDTSVPKEMIKWNWTLELPFGRGKGLGRNMSRWLDAVVGGWRLSSMGAWNTRYFALPTSLWPTGEKVEYYGEKYKVEDCRSGTCIPGYLLWNGYIPAHQINSVDPKTGKPNGVMGVPSDYKAAAAPLWPYPANYPSLTVATDPNYGYYGGNTVVVPLASGAKQQVTYGALHPWINQPILATNTWNFDASLNKNFNFTERMRLRVQIDAFNAVNRPGNSASPNTMGVALTNTNVNTPRQLQLSARFYW